MYEEEVLRKLYDGISQRLRSSNDSRVFYTQSVINLTSNNGLDILENIDNKMLVSGNKNKIDSQNNNDNFPENRKKINDDKYINDVIADHDDGRTYDEDDSVENLYEQYEDNSTEKQSDSNENKNRLINNVGSSSSSFSSSSAFSKTKSNNTIVKTAPHKFVRTDPTLTKINAFYKPSQEKFLRSTDEIGNEKHEINASDDNEVVNGRGSDGMDINNESNEKDINNKKDKNNGNDDKDDNQENYCGICLPTKLSNKINNKKNNNEAHKSVINIDLNGIKSKKNDISADTNVDVDGQDGNEFNIDNDKDQEQDQYQDEDEDEDNDFKSNKIPIDSIDCSCCGIKGYRNQINKKRLLQEQNNNDEENITKKSNRTNNYRNTNIDNISNNYSNTNNSEFRRKLVKFTETKCQYASIQALILELKNCRHEGLEKILRNHTFVGIVDGTYCSVQYGTKLLLLDYNILLYHLFYQLTLRKFGEMSRIILAKPVPIKEFVLSALDTPESGWKDVEKDVEQELELELASKSDSTNERLPPPLNENNKDNGQEKNQIKLGKNSKDFFADRIVATLIKHSEMLQEYFKIGINKEGYLCTLPDLLGGYIPGPLGLPMFLLRLVTETNWEDEMICFRLIAKEIGYYYSSLPIYYDVNDNDFDSDIDDESKVNDLKSSDNIDKNKKIKISELKTSNMKFEEIFSSLLFPAIRIHLIAPKQCATDGSTVVQLAALEQLFKIFERC